MNIAIIKDNVVINAVVFDDIETARQFFDDGVFPEADDISELPDGYGIGDSCINGGWVKEEAVSLEDET